MILNIRVVDYTIMNLKELQKAYTKEAQILLDMINKRVQYHIVLIYLKIVVNR